MEVLPTIRPEALFTTLCAASNTPMTMFHVLDTMSTAAAVLKTHLKNTHVSMSDEYCQDGFSNRTVNTLRTRQIYSDFRAKRAWNPVRKINACRIREVSAACAYGLHHSAIHGIVQPVRGFAWPFTVWLIIIRFCEVQRCALRTGYRMWCSKSPETKKALCRVRYAAQG